MYASALPHQPPGAVVMLDVAVEAAVVLDVRHRQVAGQDVVERRDVGRALDRRVAAQRHDPAARPADVPEQQLDDRRGADQLDARRVLRPADGVAERAGPLAARSSRRASRRRARNSSTRAAARVGDELRRVARVVALQDLEDAARVLQRVVLSGGFAVREAAAVRRRGRLLALRVRRLEALLALAGGAVHLRARVLPGRHVVLALLGVPAGEEAVVVLGVRELARRRSPARSCSA